MLEREFVLKLGFVRVGDELSEGALLKLEYREAGLVCVLKGVSFVQCLSDSNARPTFVVMGFTEPCDRG
jgi:hypothetical protein